MKKNKTIIVLFLVIAFCSWGSEIFAQLKEEKQERTIDIDKLLVEESPSHKIISRAASFIGYDNNVNLASTKKGDIFEEYIYSLGITKPLSKDLFVTLNYDLDAVTYNEITDTTNIVNHVKLGILKKTKRFHFATGYDFSSFYYPNDEENQFVFHKLFFYVRDYLAKGLYHQVSYERGLKVHLDKKALDGTISTYQDKDLNDNRDTYTYSIGSVITKKLFLQIKSSIIYNNSNARYIDYYDYTAYRLIPSLYYKLTKKIQLFSNFMYMRKNYKNRTVTYDDYKQKDNLYVADIGARFSVTKNSILSISYSFRDNSSNDYTQKYNGNVFKLGWQYNF